MTRDSELTIRQHPEQSPLPQATASLCFTSTALHHAGTGTGRSPLEQDRTEWVLSKY